MNDIKKIVWLTSYPKSGNTWFRAFLSALLNPGKSELDINKLYPTPISSSRDLFDEIAGIASSDLTNEEIENLRPEIYRENARLSNQTIYHKTHDAWRKLSNGTPLFPSDVTKSVIYILRNPLDIVISFSHHLNISIDRTIKAMNNSNYAFCNKTDRLQNQLEQKLFSWSEHVTSWIDDSQLPCLIVRYEDMKTDPIKTFGGAMNFLGISSTVDQLKEAIEKSSFETLKQQEKEKGFSEKSPDSACFFRKGIIGEWTEILTPEQAKSIIKAHGHIMKRFGYL